MLQEANLSVQTVVKHVTLDLASSSRHADTHTLQQMFSLVEGGGLTERRVPVLSDDFALACLKRGFGLQEPRAKVGIALPILPAEGKGSLR